MNWYQIFYWVTVADGVKQCFDVFSNLFTVFSAIGLVFYVVNRIYRSTDDCTKGATCDMWGKHFGRFFWISLVLCIITWMGYMLTPSKKDALVIIAGGAVGNFITSDSSAKQIPTELTTLLRDKIRAEIKEIGSVSLVDTLQDKSREELIEILKNKK